MPRGKKKDGPHPQLSMLDDLEEIPRGNTDPPKRKKKTSKKKVSSSSSGKKKEKSVRSAPKKRKPLKPGRDVRLSTTDPKANRNVIEKEYKGFQVWVSDKEGRDANKTMATIEGKLGKYVFRTYLRLDGENDTIGVAKAARAIIDRLVPDKKKDAKEN